MRRTRLKSSLPDATTLQVRELHRHAQACVEAWTAAVEAHGSLIQSWIGGRTVVVDERYPDPDIVDYRHGYQFFYHCHRHGSSEHGHLHLFFHARASARRRYRRKGQKSWQRTAPTHLLAIGFDARGLPISLFTVNRWVTNGFWFDAAVTLDMLRRFRMQISGPYAASANWLNAFVHMYLPLIGVLLSDRDRILHGAATDRTLDAVLCDQRRDLLSALRIDWVRDIADLETGLGPEA